MNRGKLVAAILLTVVQLGGGLLLVLIKGDMISACDIRQNPKGLTAGGKSKSN